MTEAGLALVKRFEGFRGLPYHDVVGVETIGYGTALPITEDEATLLLRSRLDAAERAVTDMVRVTLTPTQHDALVDFVYNLGAQAFHASTLLKEVNAKNFGAVPDEFRRWVYAGGMVRDGLVRRREAEIALWSQP